MTTMTATTAKTATATMMRRITMKGGKILPSASSSSFPPAEAATSSRLLLVKRCICNGKGGLSLSLSQSLLPPPAMGSALSSSSSPFFGSCRRSSIITPLSFSPVGDMLSSSSSSSSSSSIQRRKGSTSRTSGGGGSSSATSSNGGSSSVSHREVSKFAELSKQWWDPRYNPLVGMNTIRMKYIVDQIITTTVANKNDHRNNSSSTNSTKEERLQQQQQQHCQQPLHGLRALDVGCGGGILSESLARLGCSKVTGIDPSTELVEQAKLHAKLDPRTTTRIEYLGGMTVEELAATTAAPPPPKVSTVADYDDNNDNNNNNNKYDIICLLEVVEHVTDLDSILHACKQLLKPRTGRLFVSTINRTWKSHAVAIVGAEYIMNYLPVGTHDWNKFYNPDEILDEMTCHGFEQLDVQGMVLTKPPPIPIPAFLQNVTGGSSSSSTGEWSWKLDPNDKDVNWIGTYKLK